ncbi:MAG: sialidase family protein, partial [Myxococcales bacterium]|nr:sialidase family protein [Myxococcales bacterium]
DDGDLCEAGVCIDGRCSLRCDPTLEFGTCPEGQRCNEERFCVPDECFEVTCEPDEDGALTVCVEGECVPKCETVACREPNVCRPEDGACVGNNCTFLPHLCDDDELCVNSMCQRDECAGVSCDEGEFCREGTCVGSCARITCEPGTRCVDGTCEGTGCEATCNTGQICDPEAGACVANPCSGAAPCEQGDVCDPRSGKCVDDPCQTITCPSDEEGEPQTCYLGQCLDRDDPALPSPGGTGTPGTGGGASGDGGVAAGGPDDGRDEPTGDYVNVTGGAACSVRSAGTLAGRGGDSALAWLAIPALGLGLRRRARVVPDACTLSATMLALVLLTGCRVDPFCLRDCPGDPAADGSGPINSGAQGPGGTVIPGGPRIDGGTPADGGAFSPDGSLIGCTKTRPLDDDCNERDDDCDGRVDEDIDLYRDLSNCGACGVTCALAGAQTTCEGGQCIALGCFNGFVDLNDDTDGVFKGETDGCEYECFVTNDSVEGCDGIDNDCDGRTDEDTDLNTDDDNCGVCGRFCEFFQAEGHCEEGSCTFDPLNDCKAGFIDQNDVQSDGCEFECAQSNNGAETCDGLDNDCDGRTDEDYDLPNSITDCGKCGRACEFQHATPHCNDGTCEFDPNTDCEEGFSDRDGIQLNGCEFDCTVTNNGVEICDGLDNDCNGVVDGVTTDSGGSCTLAPMGTAEGACTETGTVTCVNTTLLCLGAPEPTPELCDDVDNDCDGNVDEDTVDAGRVCEQPEGICSVGLTECQAGGNLACVRAVEPLASEFCNALDDDCDGTVDEDPDMVGEVCGTDTGECTAGTIECNSGTLECSSATAFGNPETCNDRDDDCDGNTDNTPIDEGGPCGTNVGACVQGTEVCTDGRLECQGGVRPAANESCNDSDDDCDGTTDEDLTRSCYDGAAGTENNLPCQGGTQTCAAGDWGPCNGQVLPEVETCNDVDDDCDGTGDESLTLDCYTGAGGTEDVGVCRGGHLVCSGGSFSGACIDEVVPSGEDCDGLDNDCDDKIDEDDSGNDTPRSEACYTGTSGTEGVGPCAAGTRTCISSNWGACTGEVVDEPHVCGDGVDNDCDGDDDATEGCLTQGPDTRIDGGSAGGAHSFDVRVAVGGSPLGRNVYVVWSDLRNGTPDLYLARSTDGGQSFGTATNLTNAVTQAAVKPEIVVARDGSDDRVYIAYQRVTGSDVRWLYVLRSSNSGSSFSSETIVTTSDTDNFKHDVATSGDGGDVVVVWEQLHTDTLARDVYARSSDDNGNNWTSTEKISVNSGATPIAGKPRAVILDSLRRVFVWREARAPRSSFDVFATYASHAELDSGSPPAGRESQLEPDAADDQQSDAIVVAAAGDRVYVAWNDLATLTSGEADVLFSHSTDQGVTWSTGRVIDDPAVELSRSYGPTIAVDPMASGGSDDRVYLAWPDTRQGSQIYFAASSDGGDTFASPVRASQAMGDPIPDVARSPELVLVGGDQLVISYAAEDASEVTHVYAAASIDMGATWLYTDHLLDDGNVDAIEPVSAGVSSATSVAGAAVFWLDFQNDTDQENGDVHRSIVAP